MIANLTRTDHCPYCEDEGQLPVAARTEAWIRAFVSKGEKKHAETSAEVDEYGPCPRCEKGRRMEFPPPDAKGNARFGPWGADGFWRGRTPDLGPVTVASPLSRSENSERMAELRDRIGKEIS